MTFNLEAMRKAKAGATVGRRVQFNPKYCPEALGTPRTTWDNSHDTSVILPDGARLRGYAHYKHAADAEFDAMAPDMADEIERLTEALETAREDALREAAAEASYQANSENEYRPQMVNVTSAILALLPADQSAPEVNVEQAALEQFAEFETVTRGKLRRPPTISLNSSSAETLKGTDP